MRILVSLSLLLAGMLLAATATQAVPIAFVAELNGPSENPPNASPGTGFATVTIDTVAHTMGVDVTFSGLLGNVTASHIHCCTDPPGNIGVATPVPTFPGFPSGVTAGTYSQTFDLTLTTSYNPTFFNANGGTPASAEAALVAGIEAGRAYLNIHTSQFGGGEIRGFLRPVPEPTTMLLLGSGLLSLVGFRRKFMR